MSSLESVEIEGGLEAGVPSKAAVQGKRSTNRVLALTDLNLVGVEIAR